MAASMSSSSMAKSSLRRRHCPCYKYISALTTSTSASLTRLSLFSNPKKTRRRVVEPVSNPPSALDSGLEASITDPKDNNIIVLKNAKVVVVESQEEEEGQKIQLRVEVSGDDTQKVFDKVLTNLGRSAPPIPGFRRQKGGKTSKVPRDFLLQILGEERVTKFVIQEIVSSSIADYVKKENLNVKENKVNTIQKAEELKKLFTPGIDFGFNAVIELEKSETSS